MVFFVILVAISILLMGLTYHYVHAEDLKVLESQLNENSITGVLQNPYNYTVGYILPRAEFYDKEDGHLVGIRDFGMVSKDELKPGEKSTYKIWEHAGETEEFPKTDFIVKAEGNKIDETDYDVEDEVPSLADATDSATESMKSAANAAKNLHNIMRT